MRMQPQDLIEGPLNNNDDKSGRSKRSLDVAGGVVQALTIALVLATISTVLKLDKNVCVMDKEYESHRQTLSSMMDTIQAHTELLSENRERLVTIENKYVDVNELKAVWEQFSTIKGDVIKNSLTINPNIQSTLNDINTRLKQIEQTLHK